MVFVYITCKDKKEAKKISSYLLSRRLIACTNFFPIESSYWWKRKIVNAKEYAILLKTKSRNFKAIEKEIEKIHSYEVPCICMIKSTDSKKFGAWVNSEAIGNFNKK